MPLSPDASLYIPYTVEHLAGSFVAVQKQGDDIIFMSSVAWPTQTEAERHAHDLNYLRERTLESMTTTNLWVSVDIVSDGPDALVIFEKVLGSEGRIAGWRLLNPAADEDNDSWTKARDMVRNAIESIAQEDLPFPDEESLEEHLRERHGFDFEGLGEQPTGWFIKHHRELHPDAAAAENLDHTHEWSEEVEDDASDEEEGAHEDTDS